MKDLSGVSKSTFKLFYLGSLWKFVEGEAEGQTATDCNRIDQESIFSHPIDLHLACRGIQGKER